MARRRRKLRKVEFDLNPMIDVTFQLLIFFIVTMKIKQKERHAGADLPTDEGPSPTDAEPKDFIVIRLFWRESKMTYEVNVKHGNDMGKNDRTNILAGDLITLINDRADPQHTAYERVFSQLYEKINALAAKYSKAEKFEIALANDTQTSSREQIPDTAPWGFVTLVVDVVTKFNQDRGNKGLEPFGVTFKNTVPEGIR